MWVCPKCGEQHEDQFTVCWKCAGDELTPADAGPAAPPLERRLRPLSSILVRAIIASVLGFLFGAAVVSTLVHAWLGPVAVNAITVGLYVGAAVGFFVGLFIWVVFPYEPIDSATKTPHQNP